MREEQALRAMRAFAERQVRTLAEEALRLARAFTDRQAREWDAILEPHRYAPAGIARWRDGR